MMTLYPHQDRIVSAIETGWDESAKQLIIVPTGGGKTIIFAHLAHRVVASGGRVLILAHREELIDQAIAKLHAATGLFAGKEKAEVSASRNDSVVVASIQSMIRRLDRWPQDHFALVVVDEAHHAISPMYQTVLQHFDGAANVLGVTATPDRGDKKNLGTYFDAIGGEIGLFELINGGYLSRIKVKSVPIQIDLTSVRQTVGDFNETDLGDALTPYLVAIADAIREHASFRRTLAFLPLRATSRAFVEACIGVGIAAAHVDGDSPDRKEILQAFADGEHELLSNAMLLTEGYDHPQIDCIVCLRPTRSRALYAQMIGRGTRTHDLKDDLLLLDFLWMHERHKLARPASLIAKNEEEADAITARFEAGGGGEEDLETAAGGVREDRERGLAAELEQKAKRKSKFIDTDEFCMMMHQPDLVGFEPESQWDAKPLTGPQSDMLTRAGFDVAEIKGRGHASRLIDLVVRRQKLGLCTAKQMRLLKKFGVSKPEEMTFAQASYIIGQRIGNNRKTENV